MPERNSGGWIEPGTGIVGAAMRDAVCHPGKCCLGRLVPGRRSGPKTRNSAHIRNPFEWSGNAHASWDTRLFDDPCYGENIHE